MVGTCHAGCLPWLAAGNDRLCHAGCLSWLWWLCMLWDCMTVHARRYVQLEARAALHMKATLVAQAARSAYRHVEARLGGRLSRQDLGIQQARARPFAWLRVHCASFGLHGAEVACTL